MNYFYIYGITRDDGFYSDPDEAIDAYYYYRKDGSDWVKEYDGRQNVVDKVKSGAVSAYTLRNGKVGALCEVKVSYRGTEYLKTVPNNDPTDNLASLPEM